MIDRKLNSEDDFWDIRAQESRTQDSYKKQIDQLKRVIHLGRQTLSLRGQPGFVKFIEAIDGLREAEQAKLVACYSGNDHMRIIQGKAQALNDILALLRDTEKSIEGLEARLKAVQNEMSAVLTDDGKVITEPLGVRP